MSEKKILSHSIELDIPFFDVDSMHIVWHGHYVKYMELARCALLNTIAYNYDVMRDNGYAWPVVQLHLKFIKSATFGQRVRVDITMTEFESCLKFNYVITDLETGERLTKASSMQMVVKIATRETQYQTPESFRRAVYRAIEQQGSAGGTAS